MNTWWFLQWISAFWWVWRNGWPCFSGRPGVQTGRRFRGLSNRRFPRISWRVFPRISWRIFSRISRRRFHRLIWRRPPWLVWRKSSGISWRCFFGFDRRIPSGITRRRGWTRQNAGVVHSRRHHFQQWVLSLRKWRAVIIVVLQLVPNEVLVHGDVTQI